MKHTVVNVRGTNGSGKTTAVRAILKRWPVTIAEVTHRARGDRPLVYCVHTPSGPMFMFGSYETDCGGCDTISDYKTIVPALLDKYAPKGNILFEGYLLSGAYGAVGEAMKKTEEAEHTVIFAFLDTPSDVCIKRVEARRAVRGVEKPFNPVNLLGKYGAIESVHRRALEMGHRCEVINYQQAPQQIMKLFGVEYAIRLRR